MSRGEKKETKPAGMFVAVNMSNGNEGWCSMEQLPLEFSDSISTSEAKGTTVWFVSNVDQDRVLPLLARPICCCPPTNVRFAGGPVVLGGVRQTEGKPVVQFSAFRDAKLREARLSFLDKVLAHAKSLNW